MLKKKNILVVGDAMLDIYYKGDVKRISPEAPVPIFKKLSERYVLGGAANVAANLTAANQNVSILTLIGNDESGKKIIKLFEEIGVDQAPISFWNRPTITKTRFLAENNQQVMRLDIEESQNISEEEESELLQKVEMIIDKFDLVLFSDYMKGIFTHSFTQKAISLITKHDKKVIIDVKDPDYKKYKGAWLLKPNKNELHSLTQLPVSTDEEIIYASKFLLDNTNSEYILTTCGSKGMVLVGKDMVYHLDTVGKSVYDVTGAGDTTVAYLSAAVANGIDIITSMKISNYAAGLQVSKVGTSSVYLHEVEDAMNSYQSNKKRKVFHFRERNELSALVQDWHNKGEKVITTNGCFDIIHKGHISLLETAKTYGDHLIVLVNTDKSVKRLKGEGRPINNEEDRALVISALDCVDAVVLFDPEVDNRIIPESDWNQLTETQKITAKEAPMGILKLLSPDIHVKGGDYTKEQVPESMYAEKFISVPFVSGYSTTNTIKKSQA